ncbi:hypothetical protein HK405_011073, partial [Cladochytrium tenue]
SVHVVDLSAAVAVALSKPPTTPSDDCDDLPLPLDDSAAPRQTLAHEYSVPEGPRRFRSVASRITGLDWAADGRWLYVGTRRRTLAHPVAGWVAAGARRDRSDASGDARAADGEDAAPESEGDGGVLRLRGAVGRALWQRAWRTQIEGWAAGGDPPPPDDQMVTAGVAPAAETEGHKKKVAAVQEEEDERERDGYAQWERRALEESTRSWLREQRWAGHWLL